MVCTPINGTFVFLQSVELKSFRVYNESRRKENTVLNIMMKKKPIHNNN